MFGLVPIGPIWEPDYVKDQGHQFAVLDWDPDNLYKTDVEVEDSEIGEDPKGIDDESEPILELGKEGQAVKSEEKQEDTKPKEEAAPSDEEPQSQWGVYEVEQLIE